MVGGIEKICSVTIFQVDQSLCNLVMIVINPDIVKNTLIETKTFSILPVILTLEEINGYIVLCATIY